MIAADGAVWGWTLTSVLVVSLVSLLGILAIVGSERSLRAALPALVSFAVGALLGDALIHIIPELSEDGGLTAGITFLIAGSIVAFFVLEKFIHLHHRLDSPSEAHLHPVALNNLIGDGIHNFADGAIVAGAFIANVPLGIATTAAVALHEIPQEIGDLGVLVHSGLRPRRALAYNLASALAAVLGAVLALLLEEAVGGLERPLLAISAGAFIYIAGADLIPEMHRATELRTSILQFVGIAAGFAIMGALLFLE